MRRYCWLAPVFALLGCSDDSHQRELGFMATLMVAPLDFYRPLGNPCEMNQRLVLERDGKAIREHRKQWRWHNAWPISYTMSVKDLAANSAKGPYGTSTAMITAVSTEEIKVRFEIEAFTLTRSANGWRRKKEQGGWTLYPDRVVEQDMEIARRGAGHYVKLSRHEKHWEVFQEFRYMPEGWLAHFADQNLYSPAEQHIEWVRRPDQLQLRDDVGSYPMRVLSFDLYGNPTELEITMGNMTRRVSFDIRYGDCDSVK